ncbi:bifunctional diguanylate cyclase/phosphodiesterase [Vibrio sp. RC27]
MTLYKQIVSGMIALFIVLISAVFIIELSTTRANLEQQQDSEVTNTINALGLALAPYLDEDDAVASESVINALFDGSSYSLVKLDYIDDSRTDIERIYPISPSNVPSWFTSFELFEPIHKKAVLTSNSWKQQASIEIVSHPGGAYQQLWSALNRLVVAFGFVFIIALVAIAIIIRYALKPLQTIVEKMEQVARNQFGSPLPHPRTKDLVYVVDGINYMSAQVEKGFKNQVQEAQRLRERAYIDPVSRLGNRSFYMTQLNSWLTEGGIGAIAILQASYMEDLYKANGYEIGDKAVKELADKLRLVNNKDVVLGRLSEFEFAYIFPNIEDKKIPNLAENILNAVADLNPDPTGMASAEVYLGIVSNKANKTTSDIMSFLDNALAAARVNPKLPYGFIASENDTEIMGKQQWKALVEDAIDHGYVKFRYQSASNKAGDILHNEVFSSIEKDGQRYSAIQYLFALEQLGVSHIFDQYVIQQIVSRLENKTLSGTYAINIAPSSIKQPSFIRWVNNLLSRNPTIAQYLHFELPESCFIDTPHYSALFCNAVRNAGAYIGVDNYGRHFESLDYLNEYRPKYVKLDYLFTHHLDDEKQTYTLTSISRTAQNLDIITIASRVETTQQLEFLADNFIDVFQGFIVDK